MDPRIAMHVRHAAVVAVLLVFAGPACKQAREPPHEHALHLPPVGPSLAVRFGGRSVDLPLEATASGAGARSLDSIWRAAFPREDPAGLSFDLVGSDGFRPMSRPKCARLLTAAEFSRGRMDTATHDVTYDAELNLPGCYRVRHVVAIEAFR